jgi:SAM-dependent methyltransferase
MNNLYSNLSAVYEAMYQSFINYDEEYLFYSNLLTKYNCTSLLEIGCGTGHLASRFIKNNFNYKGLDVSDDMLAIAKQNNTTVDFINGDMRGFNLQTKVDACIITGRTISYLLSNKDVLDTFTTLNKNLSPSGIICFDCIDANKFMPLIDLQKIITHKASFENKKYRRDSIWKINLKEGFAFDWASVYYEENNTRELYKIGEDNSTIRTFTKDEIILFLQLSNFTVNEIIERPSYAFDTFVIIAQKSNFVAAQSS